MIKYSEWQMPTKVIFFADERTFYFCIWCSRYFASDRFAVNCGCHS